MSNIHVAFVNGERYCWYLLLNTNKDFSIIFVHCGSAINFNTDHIGNVSKITNCFVNIIIHGKRGIRPSGWSSKTQGQTIEWFNSQVLKDKTPNHLLYNWLSSYRFLWSHIHNIFHLKYHNKKRKTIFVKPPLLYIHVLRKYGGGRGSDLFLNFKIKIRCL